MFYVFGVKKGLSTKRQYNTQLVESPDGLMSDGTALYTEGSPFKSSVTHYGYVGEVFACTISPLKNHVTYIRIMLHLNGISNVFTYCVLLQKKEKRWIVFFNERI